MEGEAEKPSWLQVCNVAMIRVDAEIEYQLDLVKCSLQSKPSSQYVSFTIKLSKIIRISAMIKISKIIRISMMVKISKIIRVKHHQMLIVRGSSSDCCSRSFFGDSFILPTIFKIIKIYIFC